MYYFGKWIYHLLTQAGFNPLQLGLALAGLPRFILNAFRFMFARKGRKDGFACGRPHPCLADRYAAAGEAKGHYFHQDLWVAQRIFRNQPRLHVDVGSRVDGFVGHVASFRPIEVFDLRPNGQPVANIRFRQADFMLPNAAPANYCDSVSCLSVLEHFGLGRYGDRIDPDGFKVGWRNLLRMLKDGGRLYFSVPIGPQRIEFDAHRVFSLAYLLHMIEPDCTVEAFVYVDDQGRLQAPRRLTPGLVESNGGCFFGCGIFELRKRAPRARPKPQRRTGEK